jgi:CMP-N-acetylneuraminic acid synthetase
LGGRPLIDYTVNAALRSRRLDASMVSTDSVAIAEHARSLGAAVPELRPAEIAGDFSPVVAALQHALAVFERAGQRVDAVVLLQPTSPFRTSADIDRAIEVFEGAGADTVTAVRPARDHPYWTWRERDALIEPFFSLDSMVMERHRLPRAYAENGAVYVTAAALVRAGRIYGERIAPYVMAEAASVDIDTPLDLAWAEFLLARGLAGDAEGAE